MLDDLLELIDYAGHAGFGFIRTGTNGFVFRDPNEDGFEDRVSRIARKLAATPLRNFWISVDSAVPEVHEEMRGFQGIVEGIRKAIPIFHAHGVYPTANLGMNRNVGGIDTASIRQEPGEPDDAYAQRFHAAYASAIERFYRFVVDMGFTVVSTCYPMSIDPDEDQTLSAVYAASSVHDCVRFSPLEKAQMFHALMDVIPEFRDRVRIFSPLSNLLALRRQYEGHAIRPYPCRGGIDFFFIDARDGNAYPCGYRGNESFGKYWDTDGNACKPGSICHECDWECFRDPSELMAPIALGLRHPLRLARRMMADPLYRKLWIGDLSYYRACGLFDGRTPPSIGRMKRVAVRASARSRIQAAFAKG